MSIENYGSVVIASADTDIFVPTLHHFFNLKYFDLEELSFVSGWGNSRTFFPIHDLANHLDSDVVKNLLAVHALTRCDTASKVGTKSRAVREETNYYQLLYAFGRDALHDEMVVDAEKFLINCITKHDFNVFDELRFIIYNEKYLEFNIEHYPPTSDNIRQHILRSYLHCYIWLHSAFLENIDLDPLEHGYRLTEDSNLAPIISTKPLIPSNFPRPCNCQKCSKASFYKYQLLNWTVVCYVYRFRYIYFNCSKVLGPCLLLNKF